MNKHPYHWWTVLAIVTLALAALTPQAAATMTRAGTAAEAAAATP